MKVTKQTQKPSFKPVSLTIDFATKEELDVFITMMARNRVIPDYLSEKQWITLGQKKTLRDVMTSIFDVL